MAEYDLDYPVETCFWYGNRVQLVEEDVKIILRKDSKKLSEKLNGFVKEEVDLGIDYSNFAKLKKADVSDFSIGRHFGEGFLPGNENRFSDSSYAYVLKEGIHPIAICSFEPRPNSMLVKQIQGFKDEKVALRKIRYSDLFLNVLYEDFKELDISELWVLPYERNYWDPVRVNFQNTKKRQYDIPAKRQGFEFDEKRGIFVKKF